MHRLFAGAAFIALALLGSSAAYAAENSAPLFSDHTVSVADSRVNPTPKLAKDDPLYLYRTVIRYGAKKPANFAGHYVIIEWGCGSSCQNHAMMDVLTGRLYDMPGSEFGLDHRTGSTLLVVNPADGHEMPSWATRIYYEWDGKQFKFLKEVKSPKD